MTAPLTEEELAVIDARFRSTTPGEWLTPIGRIPQDGGLICAEDALNTIGEFARPADAHFAINARTDLPRLLAEVRRLRAEARSASCRESAAFGKGKATGRAQERERYENKDALLAEREACAAIAASMLRATVYEHVAAAIRARPRPAEMAVVVGEDEDGEP